MISATQLEQFGMVMSLLESTNIIDKVNISSFDKFSMILK